MTHPAPPRGIVAAVVTPVDAAFEPDAPRAIDYYGELLASGCDGLNVLGTTGEAMSLSARARRRFMEGLAASSLPLDRVMVGTGAAALDDAAYLTKSAFELGFAAALVMPPFFFRNADTGGIVAYFDRLFERVAPPPRGIMLYNFPAMSGIAFRGELLERLMAAFPESIGGVKDSSNDRSLQREIAGTYPHLQVYPSSESDLPEALAFGACGCISATVALSPQLAAEVLHTGDRRAALRLARRRDAIAAFALVPAVRTLIAASRDDEQWERPIPPLEALDPARRSALQVAFGEA